VIAISPTRAVFLATRPHTLPAAAVPVAVGSALAYRWGGFHLSAAIAALACAMLLQIGCNLANDVFDFERGADGPDRLGPARAVASGWLAPRAVRKLLWLVFGAALAIGIGLVVRGGWPVLAIGLGSIVAAIAYTGGPFPLGYHGLGDVFVFVCFGLVAVCGTVYVEALHVPHAAFLAAAAVGALATNILVVNNIRDMRTDARANKRTLAVRIGRGASIGEYALCLMIAFGATWALARSERSWWLLLPSVLLLKGVRLIVRLSRTEGRALNDLLKATAQLLLQFGVLLTIGLVVR
jgi:1,4-dihydroxy-2-naphthoate octaprenyltransferase